MYVPEHEIERQENIVIFIVCEAAADFSVKKQESRTIIGKIVCLIGVEKETIA